jgi:hypothetical protein
MIDFKFSIDQIVETPCGQGKICDRYDSFPLFTYRVVLTNVQKPHPVKNITCNEDELVAV